MQANSVLNHLIERLNHIEGPLMGLDIIVAFIKHSGVQMITPLIQKAQKEGIPVRVVTSTYMNVTDPIALWTLLDLLGPGSVKLYNGLAPSFHPKAYFFRSSQPKDSYVFIGSSNLSKPALTDGVEWNYRVYASTDPVSYTHLEDAFEALYTYESYPMTSEHIEAYQKTFVTPESERRYTLMNQHFNANRMKNKQSPYPEGGETANQVAESVASEQTADIEVVQQLYKPNSVQCEALRSLEHTRYEGNDKALVIAATGVGKTFLAAFDSIPYNKILFVAHREEILNQAYETFGKVRLSKDFGRCYAGTHEWHQTVVFASIQTLALDLKAYNLPKYAFDYVIVDEFHHACAPTYQKVLQHFEPKFFLGLTATPHRLDQKDIFKLCDYNVVYEVGLFQAINRDWLVPFIYYGIYDATVDYEEVTYIHGHYVEAALTQAISSKQRAELILKHYKKHARYHTLAFCSSIEHAEFMASYFSQAGVPCAALHSQNNRNHCMDRQEAIKQLTAGILKVVFSVDMLNEGVDVPCVDMVMLLRPTESPTVFFQQMGRGLRHYPGKTHLKVLDFIGNHKHVSLIPFCLTDLTKFDAASVGALTREILQPENLPPGCFIDFDLQVVDLFSAMVRRSASIQEQILELYQACKAMFGQVPNRLAFFESLTQQAYKSIRSNSKFNCFRDYIAFLDAHELDFVPEGFVGGVGHEWIRLIERTSMSKLYKVPIFLCFIQNGELKNQVRKIEIVKAFKSFYSNNRNAVDMVRHQQTKDYKTWNDEQYFTLAFKNPIHFLCKSHSEWFAYDQEHQILLIKKDLSALSRDPFFLEQMNDAICFRRHEFLDQRLESD